MQVELKSIQRRVGITFIYVTHDQGEALSMSDRVAVFNKGRIEQIGSPDGDLRASGDDLRRRLRRHFQHPVRRSGRRHSRRARRLLHPAGEDHHGLRRRGRRRRPGAARFAARSTACSIWDRRRASMWRSTDGGELTVIEQNRSRRRAERQRCPGQAGRALVGARTTCRPWPTAAPAYDRCCCRRPRRRRERCSGSRPISICGRGWCCCCCWCRRCSGSA